MIRRLPLVYRQAITWSLGGLGYEEIGDVPPISETNVGARPTHARQILREYREAADRILVTMTVGGVTAAWAVRTTQPNSRLGLGLRLLAGARQRS
jgi:hypothetical protein